MAWIESHTVLIRHRKLRELAREARLRPSHAMGHLHSLWHAALEQQEDGDLSSWSDEFIADQSDYPGDAPQWVRLLQKHRWLDAKVIHDWLDCVGRFLTSKYSTSNKERLVQIWKKHGRVYGQASSKREDSDSVANTHNQPNPTNITKPTNPAASPLPDGLNTEGFASAWGDWIEYKRQRKQKITPIGQSRLLSKLAKWGTNRAIDAINFSICQGWTGVYEEKDRAPARSAGTVRVDK